MKVKKVVILMMTMITLVGCQQTKQKTEKKQEPISFSDTYQLSYFYLESCPRCKEFNEEVLPRIEETFGKHLQITKYDLDDIKTKKPYDAVIEQLIGFNKEEDYGYGPFIVLDGYFAKLGITSGDGEEFVKDLVSAVKNQTLGTELSNQRYLFKNGKITK